MAEIQQKKTNSTKSKFAEAHRLTHQEKKNIDEKVEYEIVKSHYKMTNVGGVTNIISGLLLFWILYGEANLTHLSTWYALLVLVNVINILWAYYFKKRSQDLETLKIWRRGLWVIFSALCLVWGSITILFLSADPRHQLYTLAFLLAVVIGFTFASVTDFTLAVISVFCLLMPTIIFYAYLGINNILISGHDRALNLGISSSLVILGIFLLIVSHFGSKLVKKFFQLSFVNVALSHKLENLNKFLEQRVKERTIELEKSLNLVTFQSTHDLLTSLPNQLLLLDHMKAAIDFADKNKHMFAVIFFSINEIDRIYNALGYADGDQVIKTVAQRFQKRYNETSQDPKMPKYTVTLSRKDVFVLLLQPITDIDEIEKQIETLFTLLEQPIYTEKQVIKLTASIGVSIYPRNGRDANSHLMNADAAMLLAKQRGGNSLKMYQSEINAAITRQLELESNLHTALVKSEFILQYQPFVDLKTGQITGAEALVRWENPHLGRITPDNFIPLAEANGIIIPLSEWVMRTACAQTKIWHEQGFSNLKMAINLSAKQLLYRYIISSISRIIEDIDLKPECIELELTETTAFQKDIIPILKQLKDIGFNLSIDDFGTGYSGLSNLKLIAINKLKIDKSFVQDIATNEESKAIVSNTISLAKKINITVVAEGVETKEQLAFLQKNGCDMAQGYYFSPPVDPDVFLEILMGKTKFNI